ncbi:hypothetical protein R1flu_016931 [Riccia fluitans]|uniref:MULE transposase domain-containing protein n=1 Tax=Riccia fluitans TaxID=41844 RepID=A0ABD1YP26_9MARC
MRSKDLEVVLYEDTKYLAAIAFVIPFWCRVEAMHEIVIDSTFKTNALRFELFAMSTNIGGMGMPLSYFLFNKHKDESRGGGSDSVRKQTLIAWFTVMKERGLKLAFAITDKDLGQFSAISEALPHTYIQLCLWHAIRALESHIFSMNRSTHPYSGEEAQNVFSFIDLAFEPTGLVTEDKAIAFVQYDTSREQSSWWLSYRTRVRKLKGESSYLVHAYFGVGKEFPRYENTYRRYTHPLFKFDDNSRMFCRVLLEPELHPWAQEPTDVCVNAPLEEIAWLELEDEMVLEEDPLSSSDESYHACKEAMEKLETSPPLTQHFNSKWTQKKNK